MLDNIIWIVGFVLFGYFCLFVVVWLAYYDVLQVNKEKISWSLFNFVMQLFKNYKEFY